MIAFVDIKTGKIFSGEKPYVFWFDGGQSVNLNYVRKICIISSDSTLKASIKSDVFAMLKMDQNIPNLIDPSAGNSEYINENLYIDLNLIKSENFISVGVPYNDFFVHMIYILGSSQEAGEIHDTFYITEKDSVYEFEVAADFYADNEILKTNLDNFDISIPESIQKAIYDVNVHEESNDNITLNRKYKELLMNYWDIIANKGSYNSLQNSLAWFEWGDLVRIEELWKRHHEGMTEYFQTDLNHELNYEFITEFLNNSKTTYIGLYFALSRICMKDGKIQYQGHQGNPEYPMITPRITSSEGVPRIGNYVYANKNEDGEWIEVRDINLPGELIKITEDNQQTFIDWTQQIIPDYIYDEENPRLEPVIAKWQLLDLCLKMTLLGNFYSTYFTPIHIETIHSTVEHWVFSYTMKVLHTTGTDNTVMINNIHSFGLEYDKRIKMMDHICRNYSDTMFLNNGDVFGYETELREEPNIMWQKSGEVFKYHLGGIFGSVHFRVSDKNPILAGDENDRIISQVMQWRDNNGHWGAVKTYKILEPIMPNPNSNKYVFVPEFNIGFMNPGEYTLTFEFDTLYGRIWTKQETVVIEENVGNQIELFRVIRREDVGDIEFNNETPVWFGSFQINPGFDRFDQSTDEMTIYKEHDIFLHQFIDYGAELNHTVIFDIPLGGRVVINEQLVDTSSADEDEIYEKLKTGFPGYIWIVNRPTPGAPELEFTRVIGICREFGVEPEQIQIIKSIRLDGSYDELDYVMGYRFHPFMHRLVSLEEDSDYIKNGVISGNDLIYMTPKLNHSREIQECNWEFQNVTNGKTYKSNLIKDESDEPGGMQGWFIAPQKQVTLDPGYYNIKLSYRKGNEVQEYLMKSAFLIQRKINN